jgi:predicted metal-dependent peptidase
MTKKKKEEDTPEERFRSGVIAAANSMPLCAPAIRGLNLVMTESENLPTMAVDKYFRCYVNSNFVNKLIEEAKAVSATEPCAQCGATSHHDISYVGGVICHEAWHLLRIHHERARNTNVASEAQGYVWNVAADAEINDGLLQVFGLANVANKLCLPAGVIQPKDIEQPEGKLAEEYYYALLEDIKEKNKCGTCNGTGKKGGKKGKGKGQGQGQGQGQGDEDCPDCNGTGQKPNPYGESDCGSGADGLARDYEKGEPGPDEAQVGLSEIEGRMVRQAVAKNIQQAAKQRGNLPGGWELWANEELGVPKYNWRSELRKRISRSLNTVPGDRYRSYRRLSRRCASLGYKAILPTHHNTVPNVTVVQDTSGSMGSDAIQASMEETRGILKATTANVKYLNCDMNADKVQDIRNVRDISMFGGGGTDMRVGIRAAEETRPAPDVIILFTDGYTPWPSKPPRNSQLIVCLVGQHACETVEVPTWARTVKIVGDDIVDQRG